MQTQQPSETAASINAAYPKLKQRRIVLTVRQFSQRNPAFTELSVRNLIFKAGEHQSSRGPIPGNGLIEAGAIIRLGRRVLIDEEAFFAWVDSQKKVA